MSEPSAPRPSWLSAGQHPSRLHVRLGFALMMGLSVLLSLAPPPFAQVGWWLLTVPFCFSLKRLLCVEAGVPTPDDPIRRAAVLALFLLETILFLLTVAVVTALLWRQFAVPMIYPPMLLGALFVLFADGAPYRIARALGGDLVGHSASSSYLAIRRQPAPAQSQRTLLINNLAMLGLMLGPALLLIDSVRHTLPSAGIAFGALLFPALCLWLVDLSPSMPKAAMREDPIVPIDVGFADPDQTPPPPEDDESVQPTFPHTTDAKHQDLQLVAAVRRADPEAVKHWLGQGASADAEPSPTARDVRSALQSAASTGHVGILRLLIGAGSAVNRVSHGQTALIAATRDSYHGRTDVVNLLIANGADPNVTDQYQASALHYAARSSDPAVAQALLDAGASVDAVDGDKQTPLGAALIAAQFGVATLLLKRGASLMPPGAMPALHAAAACREDAVDGIRTLLPAKPDMKAVDQCGRTALMVAAGLHHPRLAEALLSAGCPVNSQDEDGQTALMAAARAGANRVLQRLVFWKANANLVDSQRCTALHHAVQGDEANAESIELLLALGSDLELRNTNGLTALELALSLGRRDLALRLSPDQKIPVGLMAVLDDDDSDDGDRFDRGALLIKACAQRRTEVAEALLGLGPLPQQALVGALLALGDDVSELLFTAMLSAGLRCGADADPAPLLSACQKLPPPVGLIERLLLAKAAVDSPTQSALRLLCGAAEHQRSTPVSTVPLSLIGKLLDAKAVVDAADEDGASALHYAVAHRPPDWTMLLLDRGASANTADKLGRTPLHKLLAAKRRDAELVLRALLLAGADPNQAAADGASPLGIALQLDTGLAELLDCGLSATPSSRVVPEDLPAAARAGDIERCRYLLKLGMPVDARDPRQATALIHAAGRGRVELIQLLLEEGASLMAVTDSGINAMAAAVLSRQLGALDALIAAGADVNLGFSDMTVLALAAARGDPDMVSALLARGAMTDHEAIADGALQRALQLALTDAEPRGAIGCIDLLLASGADANRLDALGRSPLLRCVGSGEATPPRADDPVLLALLKRLIAAGADLDARDQYQRTALHWTCRHSLPRATNLLLRAGSNPQQPDDLRKLPLDLVTQRRRAEFVEIFQDNPQ